LVKKNMKISRGGGGGGGVCNDGRKWSCMRDFGGVT